MTLQVNPRAGMFSALQLSRELLLNTEPLKKYLQGAKHLGSWDVIDRGNGPTGLRLRLRHVDWTAKIGDFLVRDRKSDEVEIMDSVSFWKEFDTYPSREVKASESLQSFMHANFPGFIQDQDDAVASLAERKLRELTSPLFTRPDLEAVALANLESVRANDPNPDEAVFYMVTERGERIPFKAARNADGVWETHISPSYANPLRANGEGGLI